MTYIVTTPAKKHSPRVLHRQNCKELHGRTKRVYLISGTAVSVFPLHEVARCDLCIDGDARKFAEARAEAWRGHLLAAHKELEARRAEVARQKRRQAARDGFIAQFEPLCAMSEAAWGRPVKFASFAPEGNLGLALDGVSGWDVCTIYLTATDGAAALQYEGINHSTGLIRSPQDAHRLAVVFHLIETWTAPEPFVVPAGAPDFYGHP